MQKCATLVDLEKCWNMNFCLIKSASIQPRTNFVKFACSLCTDRSLSLQIPEVLKEKASTVAAGPQRFWQKWFPRNVQGYAAAFGCPGRRPNLSCNMDNFGSVSRRSRNHAGKRTETDGVVRGQCSAPPRSFAALEGGSTIWALRAMTGVPFGASQPLCKLHF